MSDILINAGRTTEFVPIIDSQGAEETVSLQPGGRLTLSVDKRVAPKYRAEAHPYVFLNGTVMTQPTSAQGE